jgi:hypothetical protein
MKYNIYKYFYPALQFEENCRDIFNQYFMMTEALAGLAYRAPSQALMATIA